MTIPQMIQHSVTVGREKLPSTGSVTAEHLFLVLPQLVGLHPRLEELALTEAAHCLNVQHLIKHLVWLLLVKLGK